MSLTTRLIRITLIILLSALFAFLAYYLYKKQLEKYSFSSFRIENELTGVMIPNIDRLRNKVESVVELRLANLPSNLTRGITAIIENENFLFSKLLSQDCFLSYNTTDFLIAFKTQDIGTSDLINYLKEYFNMDAINSTNGIEIDGTIYQVKNFNHFLVISTTNFLAEKRTKEEMFGNADYIEYTTQFPQGNRHVISGNYHHLIHEDSAAGPKGRPLLHSNFFNYVPSAFDELQFYGSSNMSSDYFSFFKLPDETSFDWVDKGLVIVKKDSFCLMIAPQNLEQDLRLVLEEQTLQNKNDSVQISYFNIGPFEIMPFRTNFNWSSSIPGVSENFKYYTNLDNYNVLTNSIPAMRWYLGELQLGNLFFKNGQIKSIYEEAISQRAHYLSLSNGTEGEMIISGKVWQPNGTCITTLTDVRTSSGAQESFELIADFEVEINPSTIQTLKKKDSVFVLLNNANGVALYTMNGDKRWRLNLSSVLTGFPQLIDLENDGQNEIVLFQKDQIDIINASGKSVQGFPKKLNGISKGGLAVNYDNAFNYRFLVSDGNQVRSFDEKGAIVQGWLFAGLSGELKGEMSYYVTQGKDLIAFKDANNKQFVLNRRGESRLNKEIKVDLPAESSFVVGNYDAGSLRKLGYHDNYIYNYYLMDGHKDSVKLDKQVNAVNAFWLFNENRPLLVIEELGRILVLDEFGYEKNAILKPDAVSSFESVHINQDFRYVFVDNSKNSLYLLNGYGKMIFPAPVKGSNVFLLKDRLLYTFVGTKLKVYKTE